MRILHLYRPSLPSTRAQSIQVFRTCHALAEAGHDVTLFANKGPRAPKLWDDMGLTPHENFHIQLAPIQHSGLSGLWFRRCIQKWWEGPPGIILARDKKRLIQSVKKQGKQAHRIILETHELDSLQVNDQVDMDIHRLEEQCLSVADVLIANCSGTVDAWNEHHEVPVSTHVCHNATHVEHSFSSAESETVMVLGSMRENKGTRSILEAAQRLQVPFRWIGGTDAERVQWGGSVRLEAPIPHAHIERTLAEAKVLLLPLGNNAFSHRFTSPLKLWDYLATDRPIVVANTPAVGEICRDDSAGIFRYEPENIASIHHAVSLALQAPKRTPVRRTWKDRADEISHIISAVQ